jgi:hypothetical protein
MRKLILTLPVAALLLAAGVMFPSVGGAFTDSETVGAFPASTVELASAPNTPVVQPGWNETAARPISGK